VWIIVGHVMNLEIVDEEFTSLVEYIKYKLLKWDNDKLEAQWAKEHVEKMVDYVDKQMQDFDILHATEVENILSLIWVGLLPGHVNMHYFQPIVVIKIIGFFFNDHFVHSKIPCNMANVVHFKPFLTRHIKQYFKVYCNMAYVIH